MVLLAASCSLFGGYQRSEEHIAYFFRNEPWRWRQHFPAETLVSTYTKHRLPEDYNFNTLPHENLKSSKKNFIHEEITNTINSENMCYNLSIPLCANVQPVTETRIYVHIYTAFMIDDNCSIIDHHSPSLPATYFELYCQYYYCLLSDRLIDWI